MTFLSMPMLALLLIVPVLVAAYLRYCRRKREEAARFPGLALLTKPLGTAPRWSGHVPPVLYVSAITILLLGAARPATWLSLPELRATVILAMDISASMRLEDIEPSRIEAAQLAARQFLADQPADLQIGLVAFSDGAVLVQAPTVDRAALARAIDAMVLQRGTALGSGVLVSLSALFPERDFGTSQATPKAPKGAKLPARLSPRETQAMVPQGPVPPVKPGSYSRAAVILLTDGATNTGPDPLVAAQVAANQGVRVHTVGFGSRRNAAARGVKALPDYDTLQAMAKLTTGTFHEAASIDELNAVYRSLTRGLTSERMLIDISFLFAAAGAILAVSAAALSTLRYGRIL